MRNHKFGQYFHQFIEGKNDVMSNNLMNIIANVMEVEVTEIDDESGPETIENWDSFRGLILFEELESKFDVKFTLNELLKITKIRDIKNVLAIRGVSIDE